MTRQYLPAKLIQIQAVGHLGDMRLQEQQERLQKLDRRRQPSRAFRSIAKPFYEILALRAKVMSGELSATECDQQVKAIIDGAFV